MSFLFELPAEGYRIGLDWLGKFAQAIIEGVGSIGFGIIVFTLVLKAITLPFDIYQRVKMRKQNLVMRQMQPELEKLQQQYANDKNMYNQKMMELYKKNGYSMFGACLPMILSLVILIVAFQGFRTYSQYANLSMYENMSVAYNAAILEYAPRGEDYILTEDGSLTLKEPQEGQEETIPWATGESFTRGDVVYKMTVRKMQVKDAEGNDTTKDVKNLEVRSTALNGNKFIWYRYSLESQYIEKEYRLDVVAMNQNERIGAEVEFSEEVANATDEAINNNQELATRVAAKGAEYRNSVVKIGAEAARDWYRGDGKFEGQTNDSHFLWVKNVWYPDVSYNKPIQSYSKLSKELNKKVTLLTGEKRELSSVLTETQYNNITSELQAEKKAPNGYFILIILSIGFMVLSQFVSMRSSKESNKYQTVDGQGAKTQKIMMVMMPLIYAVFAFMYSAAFSIYMTMSSVVSLVVMLISNLIIDRVFKKKEKAETTERYSRKYEWQKTEKEKKQDLKRAKKDKKNKK